MRRLWLLLPLLAAACASPEPRYFTLDAVPGPALPAALPSVELRRPGLAGYLDRQDVVRSSAGYTVAIARGDRWAEPLGDLIGRVLARDLAQRLPGTAVFTAGGALSAEPAMHIDLDIQRFDTERAATSTGTAAGAVVLRAQFDLIPRHGAQLPVCAFEAIQPLAGEGTAAQAAAMSGALGQLAERLAAALRDLGANLPPGCP